MKSGGVNEKSMVLPTHSEDLNIRRVFTLIHSVDTQTHIAEQSLPCLYLVVN